MKKGDYAELKMKKVLRAGRFLDERSYVCKVLGFEEQAECLYLSLEDTELSELSLDSIYECKIKSQSLQTNCTGRVKERYQGQHGKTVRFQVENGFYKISIKSVDKQIV